MLVLENAVEKPNVEKWRIIFIIYHRKSNGV